MSFSNSVSSCHPPIDTEGPRTVLRYVLALTISAALHAVFWQLRHTVDSSTIIRTKPPATIDVVMVTPPRRIEQPPPPAQIKPIPPEPVKPPPPPVPPRTKPAIPPKKAPVLPRPVALPKVAPVQQSAPVIAVAPTTAPAPIVPAPAPVPAPVVPVQPKAESYTEARHDAAYLNNPKPEYPAMARRRSLEGKVILKVQVMASGQPGQIAVETGSGYEVLDEAAQETVKHWRFVPAKRGDKAVDSWVRVPIFFKLSH